MGAREWTLAAGGVSAALVMAMGLSGCGVQNNGCNCGLPPCLTSSDCPIGETCSADMADGSKFCTQPVGSDASSLACDDAGRCKYVSGLVDGATQECNSAYACVGRNQACCFVTVNQGSATTGACMEGPCLSGVQICSGPGECSDGATCENVDAYSGAPVTLTGNVTLAGVCTEAVAASGDAGPNVLSDAPSDGSVDAGASIDAPADAGGQ
jgi:hypothetical protein